MRGIRNRRRSSRRARLGSLRDLAPKNESRPNVAVPEVWTGQGNNYIGCGDVHRDKVNFGRRICGGNLTKDRIMIK